MGFSETLITVGEFANSRIELCLSKNWNYAFYSDFSGIHREQLDNNPKISQKVTPLRETLKKTRLQESISSLHSNFKLSDTNDQNSHA